MARVLVLDVNEGSLREARCYGLEDYYRELNAEPFDVARRFIDGKPYDIFVDDCGLLREEITVSAVNGRFEPMLVGNLIFTNHDGHGNTISLSDNDIIHIMKCIKTVYTQGRPEGYKILTKCEYERRE